MCDMASPLGALKEDFAMCVAARYIIIICAHSPALLLLYYTYTPGAHHHILACASYIALWDILYVLYTQFP